MEFTHINDVEEFLQQSKGLKDLENRLGEIPNKFGDFEIIEVDKENNFITVRNIYYDKNLQSYEIYDIYLEDILLDADFEDIEEEDNLFDF